MADCYIVLSGTVLRQVTLSGCLDTSIFSKLDDTVFKYLDELYFDDLDNSYFGGIIQQAR